MPSYYDKTVTAESWPDFDSWGPDYFWDSATWLLWHSKLKAKYGQERANQIFLGQYHDASFLAANYDWRTFDQAFIQYAKQENFYSALFPGVLGTAAAIGSGAGQLANAGAGVLSTGSDIVNDTLNFLRKAVPFVLIAVLVAGSFWLYKWSSQRS